MMKNRLNLHKLKDLIIFIHHCNVVLAKTRFGDVADIEYVAEKIKTNNLNDVWKYYSTNTVLWVDGYACLLPVKIRNTFEFYRKLSENKRRALLSKSLKG